MDLTFYDLLIPIWFPTILYLTVLHPEVKIAFYFSLLEEVMLRTWLMTLNRIKQQVVFSYEFFYISKYIPA